LKEVSFLAFQEQKSFCSKEEGTTDRTDGSGYETQIRNDTPTDSRDIAWLLELAQVNQRSQCVSLIDHEHLLLRKAVKIPAGS
jgi:hypothetical protein